MEDRLAGYDWKKAPTLYRVVVEDAVIPFFEAEKAKRTHGFALVRRRMRLLVLERRVRSMIHRTFPSIDQMKVIEPSTTRMVAEETDSGDQVHLLLWNGVRVTVRRENDAMLYDIHTRSKRGWTRSGWIGWSSVADHLARHPHVGELESA